MSRFSDVWNDAGRASAATVAVIGVVAGIVVGTSGCSSTRYAEKVDKVVEVPEEDTTQIEELGAERWCSDFGQPGLQAMVERAWSGNMELKAAWARLRQAEAAAKIAGSSLWPDVQANAEGSYSSTALRQGRAAGASWELSAAASYEVDIWGRIRHRKKAANLEADAVEASARAVAMTLTTQVAEAWFDVIAQRERVELLESQLKTSRDILEITKQRLRRGLVGAIDVAQQERNIESLRGRLSEAEGLLETSRNRLAVLVGQPPDDQSYVDAEELPDIEALPEAGVPANLLERRPDLRAAYLQLKAADHRTAAAVADRLPRLRLNASVGFQAADLANLFQQLFFSAGAGLMQPIFEGGRLKAEVERSEAIAQEQLYSYAETLLQAIRDVRDALALEQSQRERIESLRRERKIAERVLELARKRYRTGTVRYLRVLSGLQELQDAERALLEARRQQISNRISLCRALGGTWVDAVESSLPTDDSSDDQSSNDRSSDDPSSDDQAN